MELKLGSNSINWILVTFPGGDKSIMRMGVFREVFDGEVVNAEVVDFAIWTMPLPAQLKLIEKHISTTKSNIIMFVPGARLKKYLPQTLMLALKNKYSDVPILIYLLDGIERQAINMNISIEECRNLLDGADAIYSYDLYESKKYGFIYEPAPLKKFMILRDEDLPEAKVFFCGRAKGRLALIFEIADALEAHNIEYEFLILNDTETEGQHDAGGIHYIEYLVYDKVIEYINRATVLLSLVAENNNMTSISYNEAIIYNKKLLSNCAFLQDNLYYNGQYMKSFETVKDIDFEWIQSVDSVEYHYEGQYCCQSFFEHLERDYERGLLRRCMVLNRLRANAGKMPTISLHFSNTGWTGLYATGEMIHDNNALEAIFIADLPDHLGLNVEVFTKEGIQLFIQEGTMIFAGSTGKRNPISKIKMKADNKDYHVIYRCYITCVGWTEYCTEKWCGVYENMSKLSIEGIQIIIKKVLQDSIKVGVMLN